MSYDIIGRLDAGMQDRRSSDKRVAGAPPDARAPQCVAGFCRPQSCRTPTPPMRCMLLSPWSPMKPWNSVRVRLLRRSSPGAIARSPARVLSADPGGLVDCWKDDSKKKIVALEDPARAS